MPCNLCNQKHFDGGVCVATRRVDDLDPQAKPARSWEEQNIGGGFSTHHLAPSKEREARRASENASKVYHYTVTGPIEPIHVIEQFKLGFRLGSAIKYVLRADHKGQRESDLEKAINFLWRERYGTWRP